MTRILHFKYLFLLLLFSCSPKEQTPESAEPDKTELGSLQHGFKLDRAIQEKFDEGLLLLHNFEYDDALIAFEEATAIDSTEILTHWGEAMCHYKALWRLQNTEKGKAILARFGSSKQERLAFIKDPIERVMWELIEIMYGEGQFEERNEAIKAHLAAKHKEFPDHQEIAAFYALSLIWATEEYGDGSEDLKLAASITDKITKVNPMHPGALHYKIHALDGPTSAQEAIEAANAYAKVAADATHALHMPSHIFLAMGEWNGVVNSNKESYTASVNRVKDLNLMDGKRGYHSLAWLHYGLLQQGKYAEAEKILNEMLLHVPKDPTKGARGYLVGMQSRHLSESGSISKETPVDLNVKVDDIGIMPKSVRSFLRAQIAYENKDTKTIKDEINWLSKKIIIASQQIEGDGTVMCATGNSRYAPTENAINSAKVTLDQIQGMLALLEGKEDQFKELMVKATTLENQTNFPAGPPRITKPSFEQYGEWLIKQGDYTEALNQFDKALLRMPRRHKSLKGKLTALKELKLMDQVVNVQNELNSVLAHADTDAKKVLID